MHRSLAAFVATFAAIAALCAGSTAVKAQAVSCAAQRDSCLKACHHPGGLCQMHCNGPYQFCRYKNKIEPKPGGVGAKPNDARPKKGFDPSNTGTWVPNSPAKGKGVPSAPTGGTWTPSPSSGARGPILRSSGGRR
jgi:hypothetical protein